MEVFSSFRGECDVWRETREQMRFFASWRGRGRRGSSVFSHFTSFILSFSSFPPRACSGGFWLPALGSFLLHIFPHFYGEQFVVVRAAYVSVLALFGVETYRLGQVVCRTVFVNLGYSYHFPPIVEEWCLVDFVVSRLCVFDKVGYDAAFFAVFAPHSAVFPIEGELGVEFPKLVFCHFRPT